VIILDSYLLLGIYALNAICAKVFAILQGDIHLYFSFRHAVWDHVYFIKSTIL